MGRTKKQAKVVNQNLGVAFIRASKDEQKLTPDAQRKSIETFAQANGIEIVSYFEDLGISGAADLEDRVGLLEALAALESHNAGFLVIANRTRLARDIVAAATIERIVEKSGAKIVSADSVGNGTSPESQMMKGIVDVFSQYERALIRSRTKAALAVKKAKGEWLGKSPYGYKLASDGVSLETVESELEAINIMRKLRAGGFKLQEVCNALENFGIRSRSGKNWTPMTIKRIVERVAA